jgi:hypothetical protein
LSEWQDLNLRLRFPNEVRCRQPAANRDGMLVFERKMALAGSQSPPEELGL